MTEVLVAMFSSVRDAQSVRNQLMRDGFPIGRVEFTARGERAGPCPLSQYERYFGTFFDQRTDRDFVGELAKRVASGEVTTIAIHACEESEASRATEILENQGALEVVPSQLESLGGTNAAEIGSWLEHLIPEHEGAAGRFCRFGFPGAAADQNPL